MSAREDREPVGVSAPRFEQVDHALGIGAAAPRLSWRTHAPAGWRQAAWQAEARRASGIEEAQGSGAEQVLVSWPFAPLASRERAEVRLRVRADDGDWSPWGAWAPVEAGLLSERDWAARPVGAGWDEAPDTERRPALVRRAFALTSAPVSARLYVTAHGLAEVEINGCRVGDHELMPGWTSYGDRLVYWTFDVTEHLRAGENRIGAWLGDGWYRGRLGFNGGYRDLYGTDQSLIAQLEVTLADGSVVTVATDEDWEAAPSPVMVSGLYDGEVYDARAERAGWSSPGDSADGWSPVAVHRRDPATLVAPTLPPVRATEELEPVAVEAMGDGGFLLDFGQNLVGRLRVRVDGAAGHEVVLRHAEVLEQGALGIRPLRLADARDVLTLDGRGPRSWEPRFTFHGFRYATIHGVDEIRPGDVVARVLHSDMRRTGTFRSSNEELNRLHENVVWGMRGNFVSIPTDCPQRDERLGWTGDIQVFAPTASFLYDCAGFLESWLQDVALEQLDDGTVPWFVPSIPGGPTWNPIRTGAVWGDVAVLTPLALHERFGDEGVVEAQHDSGRAWVERMIREAGEERLWRSGQQLGDWLDPAAPPEDPADARTDRYLVAQAYFAFTTRRMADMARLVGRTADAERYARIAGEARDAFRAAYVTPVGLLTSDAQTAYALAIRFDLLSAAERVSAGDRLAALVREAGGRIASGFAGTPVITDALTDTGHLDEAYLLLLATECPSWLYTVRQGGTTIWERWDSMLADGTINPGEMTSFNHYALGSVADWMHRAIGGLAPAAPGYRRVVWRPRPGGGLDSAEVGFDSPYGEIRGSWAREGERIRYRLAVPTGVDAEIHLPGADAPIALEPGATFEVVA
ncbi:alpha-L-rhamnosidase [Microbacterium excoecariae]|uniref:alpha-L-rhamnosidase n=1 Tax=Microbacterium excoecariae TaxID=2715210 RepID=UPI00140BD312|nr:alpha-L-rhamnosidase [Microbacterium excoecariae]NHI15763.1 family 78 glycoside hydrolase catalytic domain [Microbacterium excoecariae]